MGSFFQRKAVRRFFHVFKWCRVSVLLTILALLGVVAYTQVVGLPQFLKNPLLRTLRQRGFDAQFTNARLGWGPSIIIENAEIKPVGQANGPYLTAKLIQMELHATALLHARLQVDSFEVVRAGLRIPVSVTNEEPLSLTEVSLHVSLPSTNLAILDSGAALVRGVRVRLSGEISYFFALRDWRIPAGALPSVSAPTHAVATQTAPSPNAWEILKSIGFGGTPELNLHFKADGRDLNSLRAELRFDASSMQTPWGQTGPLNVQAACSHLLDSGRAPFLQSRISARDVSSPLGTGRAVSADLEFSRDAKTNISAAVRLAATQVAAPWPSPGGTNRVSAANLEWTGDLLLPFPSYQPDALTGTLSVAGAESAWGSIESGSLALEARRALTPPTNDPALGPWNQALPFELDWKAEAAHVTTPKLKLERVTLNGSWRAPQLKIDRLVADMYRGHLNAGGDLDVGSREVHLRAAVDFDPHQLAPLLTGPAQHWISLYHWQTPPTLSGGLRFVLPPWTNRLDAWPEDSRQSLQMAGDFSQGPGSFREVALSSASAHFAYTNRNWRVTDVRVAGPGGAVHLDYNWSELTHDYHFIFDSKLDPSFALPLLTPPQQEALREWSFTDAPEIRGDVWGNWRTAETVGFAANLGLRHFIVRGEAVEELSANVAFTNRMLSISQLSLAHQTGRVEVPQASIDFASNVIFMTNASSTIDPEPVRRALGKIAPPFMKEVHFDSPPLVEASGSFIPGMDEGTAMQFRVRGNRFHWNGITAESIQGDVDYHFRTVIVSNVQAGVFETGKLQGWVGFDWDLAGKTKFDSAFTAQDINLGAVARDLTGKSNLIEGMLDGALALRSPEIGSDTNLFGHGWFKVHNGLLWDIKLFGLFSPVLNAIAPGSGSSRAREASASFVITNGVIATDDLEIRSSGFRLLYRGTVDQQKRLDAHVEANLLRDTPVFGHFLSWMLTPVDKIFEYKVTGTLKNPQAKPLYIPKVFLAMLRPFHSLKELLPPVTPAKPPSTNSPPPAKNVK